MELIKCDFCNLTTNKLSFDSHLPSCNRVKENIDQILSEYQGGMPLYKIVKNYKISLALMNRILDKNKIHKRTKSESRSKEVYRHTEEDKIKMSNLKKTFYKNNPDRHPWKSSNKFKSIPCENFKRVMSELNITYIDEMTPSDDRFFSIDISLPEYKIGIEINGNQHYNSDSTLKDYYQKRHDYLVGLGWNIHEIHYSQCFNDDNIKRIIKNILSVKDRIFDFNYEEYLSNKLSKKINLCECGIQIHKTSKKCPKCEKISRRKDNRNRKVEDRPSKDELKKEIDEIGYSAVGRRYGVSDNSIRRWIKSYESFVYFK